MLIIALLIASCLAWGACCVDFALDASGVWVELELFGRVFVFGNRAQYEHERWLAMQRHPAGRDWADARDTRAF